MQKMNENPVTVVSTPEDLKNAIDKELQEIKERPLLIEEIEEEKTELDDARKHLEGLY